MADTLPTEHVLTCFLSILSTKLQPLWRLAKPLLDSGRSGVVRDGPTEAYVVDGTIECAVVHNVSMWYEEDKLVTIQWPDGRVWRKCDDGTFIVTSVSAERVQRAKELCEHTKLRRIEVLRHMR